MESPTYSRQRQSRIGEVSEGERQFYAVANFANDHACPAPDTAPERRRAALEGVPGGDMQCRLRNRRVFGGRSGEHAAELRVLRVRVERAGKVPALSPLERA